MTHYNNLAVKAGLARARQLDGISWTIHLVVFIFFFLCKVEASQWNFPLSFFFSNKLNIFFVPVQNSHYGKVDSHKVVIYMHLIWNNCFVFMYIYILVLSHALLTPIKRMPFVILAPITNRSKKNRSNNETPHAEALFSLIDFFSWKFLLVFIPFLLLCGWLCTFFTSRIEYLYWHH